MSTSHTYTILFPFFQSQKPLPIGNSRLLSVFSTHQMVIFHQDYITSKLIDKGLSGKSPTKLSARERIDLHYNLTPFIHHQRACFAMVKNAPLHKYTCSDSPRCLQQLHHRVQHGERGPGGYPHGRIDCGRSESDALQRGVQHASLRRNQG